MSPKRIQRRRTKGWRMPEGAVYVGRPTYWGNEYVVGKTTHHVPGDGSEGDVTPADAREAVDAYRRSIEWLLTEYPPFGRRLRTELGGRDLACWCPLVDADGEPVPCHADVLLELANSPEAGAR